jgi:hypothetical protein
MEQSGRQLEHFLNFHFQALIKRETPGVKVLNVFPCEVVGVGWGGRAGVGINPERGAQRDGIYCN